VTERDERDLNAATTGGRVRGRSGSLTLIKVRGSIYLGRGIDEIFTGAVSDDYNSWHLEYARWLEEIAPGFIAMVILAEGGEDYRNRDLIDQVACLIEIFGVVGAA
jgi:hypothetical protein